MGEGVVRLASLIVAKSEIILGKKRRGSKSEERVHSIDVSAIVYKNGPFPRESPKNPPTHYARHLA